MMAMAIIVAQRLENQFFVLTIGRSTKNLLSIKM